MSLIRVWRHLIGSFHFTNACSYFHCSSPLFNLKILKIFFDFNLLTFLLMDSILTHRYIELENQFQELSIHFDTCTYTFNDCNFMYITALCTKIALSTQCNSKEYSKG